MMLGATRNKAQILSFASSTLSLHLLNSRIAYNKHTMTMHDGDPTSGSLCPGDLRHVTDVD